MFFQNYLLAILYGSYGDILFYSILDFKSNDFATPVSILSFLISAIFLLFTVLSLVFHFWLLRKYQRLRAEAVKNRKFRQLENFVESQKGAQVMFRDFKDGSFSQQAFLLFFTLRDLLFSLVLTTLYTYPLIQITIISILGVGMLIYLFITKPFKEKFDFVQQIFCELAILVLNISILIIAIEDPLGNEAEEIRTFLGKVAIYVNVGFGLLIIGFVIIGIIIKAVNFYKSYKILQNRKKKHNRISERLSCLSFPNPRPVNPTRPNRKIMKPLNHLNEISFTYPSIVSNKDISSSTYQINEHSSQGQNESFFSLMQPRNTIVAEQLKTALNIKKTFLKGKKPSKVIDIRRIR